MIDEGDPPAAAQGGGNAHVNWPPFDITCVAPQCEPFSTNSVVCARLALSTTAMVL